LHREDGPAVEWSNGDKAWYLNGNYHRADGPAVVFTNYQSWWLNGRSYFHDEWFKLLTPEQQYNYLWNLDE
jgi:hypothetical protein